MHPYSTTSEERSKIPFGLAAIAIGLAWLLSLIIGEIHLPFWIEVPGAVTLYGLLYALFRSYIWKWSLLHRIGLVTTPNIAGDWCGYVTSTFDDLAVRHPIKVRIQQNWTHLLLRLSANNSESESVVAFMVVGDGTALSYEYRNTPKPGAKDTMHAHAGMAVLKLGDDGELSGEYYSGRDRANQGIISLMRCHPDP